MKQHYRILANCSEEQACQLATGILEKYSSAQIKILSGPKQGLVMLRVRETVADSQFNAGEVLVTEVRLELDGQFGFGMVLGDSARRAMAIALIDAALRKGGDETHYLTHELTRLESEINRDQQRMQALVATTKVNFESM